MMPVLNLTIEQIIDLVKQLSLEEQKTVLKAIAKNIGEPSENPWMQFVGMFKDDPEFDEMLVLMEEDRRQFDEKMEEYYHQQETKKFETKLSLYGDIETYKYMEKQGEIFDRMLPELLEKYQGMYVYFEDGKVLEADFDEEKLIDLAEQKYGCKSMFIEQVLNRNNYNSRFKL
ncbi:MAG: DUF5678 domain-containing protein [Spirulina sp.]